MPDLTGQQLGDYTILRRLGRGAMAEVYLAEQQSLSRRVALKVLSGDLAGDTNYVERFQHEARSAAALVHANIVQVYEVGCVDDAHFIAQEYVPGSNLGELLEKQGRLKPGLVLDILRQSAAALHKAQEGGIVHRDIKPENLMLAQGGEVKVADFGLARLAAPTDTQLTQEGVTMGTPLYMSPEQIEGRPVDVRSDLYSLGVTAYHLLVGEPPFSADTPLAVAVQHLNTRATPLADLGRDLPLRLSQIIQKLMAKAPDDRYQAPGELLSDLRLLAHQASQEGWAEGPENWTVSDLQALRGQSGQATEQLAQLMREASELTAQGRGWGRRAAIVAGALLCGALLGFATSPSRVLQGAGSTVAVKGNVLTQIYHAKMVGTESAWLAVKQRYPNMDVHHETLVDQGLARLYLRQQDFDKARRVCAGLYAKAAESDSYTRQFALAGLTIACVGQGDRDRAEAALEGFDFQLLDELNELEPHVARMFEEAMDELQIGQ